MPLTMTEEDLFEAEEWATAIGGDTGGVIHSLVAEVRRLAAPMPTPAAEPLRESLKSMRKASGLSQAALARVLGIHQTDVSDLEARSDYKVSTLRSFAGTLGGVCRVVFDFPGRPSVELVIPKGEAR